MSAEIKQPKVEAGPKRASSFHQRLEKLKDFSFAFPALLFLGLFLYYPLAYSISISFTNWNMTRPNRTFIGVDNYTYLLTNDAFYNSLKVTLYYTVMDVTLTLGIGLLLALLFNVMASKLFDFMRLIIFMPYYVSMVIAAMVFIWIYNGQYGLLNEIMRTFGLQPVDWLINTKTVLPAIVAVSVWKGVGFAMILFIAGLRGIPIEYYEAASIDGANKFQQFRKITLPLLSPMTLFLLITTFISSMQVFQSIDVMTNGGPLQASNAIVYWIYTMAFDEFRTGRASALVVILFVIILLLTLVQWVIGKRRVHYEG